MNLRITATVASMALLVFLTSIGHSEQPRDLRDFMRAKLKYSEKVLEGLVSDDMEAVYKGAQEMKLLSQESNWQVLQSEQYINFSRRFRADADALSDAAKKNKLDASTVAFNRLTTTCVECHKYVRDVGTASSGK